MAKWGMRFFEEDTPAEESERIPAKTSQKRGSYKQTIKALAGHVSKQMLERYSHIRTRAKEQAIATLHASRPQLSPGAGTKMGTISWWGKPTRKPK